MSGSRHGRAQRGKHRPTGVLPEWAQTQPEPRPEPEQPDGLWDAIYAVGQAAEAGRFNEARRLFKVLARTWPASNGVPRRTDDGTSAAP